MELARIPLNLHGCNLGQAVQKTVETVQSGLNTYRAISPRVTMHAEPDFDPKRAYVIIDTVDSKDSAQA